VRGRVLATDRPLVMGVVNVTPDSFSDGGRYLDADAAIRHAGALLAEGADVLDVGAESTRPQGATPVSAQEELRRLAPVVRGILDAHPDAVVSVDTVKADVAEAMLAAGAHIVNDVSALRLDARMAPVVATAGAGLLLMHSRGGVADMGTYLHADYPDGVVDAVLHELGAQLDVARHAGVARECLVVDPGIGFAKRPEDSLRMLATLTDLAMPKNLKMLIRIQEWSSSYHARPCRADVGCAW